LLHKCTQIGNTYFPTFILIMAEIETKYIGLMQLGVMWSQQAETMAKTNNPHHEPDIIHLYESAVHIHATFAHDLALYYEKEFYSSELIVENYRIAMEAESDSLPIINCADFYKKQKDKVNMIQCCHRAIREYKCAYSMVILALHYAGELDMDTTQMYYEMAMEHHQEATFVLDTFVETAELVHMIDFIHENGWNQENIIYHEIYNFCAQRSSVMIYRNKVNLFTALNHITECGICFNTALHLNLNCGHCVCKDCYLKLFDDPCPFCRL
jgi:hypothetical protein